MTPRCSIVIPTRNRWTLAAEAISCALEQQSVEVEVLVVDDGSDEPCPEALRRLPGLTVLRNETSGGAAGARNRALEVATGRWVAFLDDDDLWAPDRLHVHLQELEPSGSDFGYCGVVLVDGDRRPFEAVLPEHPSTVHESLRSINAIGSPSGVIVRRETLLEIGGFDERFSALADWDLWLRLTDRGPAHACPALLVAYTVHVDNMHTRSPGSVLEEFDRLQALVAQREPGRLLDRGLFTRWVAQDLDRAGHAGRSATLHLDMARRDRSARSLVRAALRYGRPARYRPHGAPRRVLGPPWLERWSAPEQQAGEPELERLG